MRMFWSLAVLAFLVLSGAAVWMGGLNQDEGWYLYAANMVADGKLLYRDFFFTQGPVMPIIYSAFSQIWAVWGILGARVFTLGLGVVGIVFATALAIRLVKKEAGRTAGLITFLLLATNLYHLYYLAIPKAYALASALLMTGFYMLSMIEERNAVLRAVGVFVAGLAFAFAAGVRISLGAVLPVVGFALLFMFRRYRLSFLWFGLGGMLGLTLAYGVFLACPETRPGLLAAQLYHAARGGFDLIWTLGSLSRLVRWYLPVFVVLGLGVAMKAKGEKGEGEPSVPARIMLFSFLAVFVVQMLAPFPYEDYQVPIMALIAVYAAVTFTSSLSPLPSSLFAPLLVLGLCFASSFGSPLLEKWMTNGQDRFWSLKKDKTELAQLREVAKRIETLDPNGRELLTQDLYLAIETNRRVPEGFEMGPFSYWGDQLPYRSSRRIAFDDATLRKFLTTTSCPLAALSGYTFAITAPEGTETPVARQREYRKLLGRNYRLVDREEAFGQNATTLQIWKHR